MGVLRAADERQRDEVDAEPQRPAQVGLVLLGERGHRDRDAGQVDPLVVGDLAADDDLGADPDPVRLEDAEAHLAVVDEDRAAGRDIRREVRVRRAHDILRARHVLGRDREHVAGGEEVRAVGESAQADLRALQVREHPDGATGLVARPARVRVRLLVHGVVAVAQVQAGDVDSGAHQVRDRLVGRGRGSEGGDDLGAAHGGPSSRVPGFMLSRRRRRRVNRA